MDSGAQGSGPRDQNLWDSSVLPDSLGCPTGEGTRTCRAFIPRCEGRENNGLLCEVVGGTSQLHLPDPRGRGWRETSTTRGCYKMVGLALAGVAQRTECRPAN